MARVPIRLPDELAQDGDRPDEGYRIEQWHACWAGTGGRRRAVRR
jgi:hypothetical protein